MSARTSTERTIEAEVRAVIEGHRAFLDTECHCFTVVSDTRPGLRYSVFVAAVGETLTWECDHLVQMGVADQARASFVPCKHGALVARRLEREGLLRWDGKAWRPTQKARMLAHRVEVIDHEHGAPSNFQARCSCGWVSNVASLNRASAEDAAERHWKSYQPVEDAFQGLPT